MNIFFTSFIFFLSFSWSVLTFAQTSDEDELPSSAENTAVDAPEPLDAHDLSKVLNLRDFIEQGLRQNPQEKIRHYEKRFLDVAQDKETYKFWSPQVRLVMRSQEQRLGSLRTLDHQRSTSLTPVGYAGIDLGEYTIFNWGKDYQDYKIEMERIQRQKEFITEQKRDLKNDLITLYFKLSLAQDLHRICQDQVRHATFLYRLGREKANVKKISRQQYFQIRSLYLRKQQEYSQAQTQLFDINKEVAYTLGDNLGTIYQAREKPKYIRINLNPNQAIDLALKSNSQIKNGELQYSNSQKAYDQVQRKMLPLPKFSIGLGSYLHTFSHGGSDTSYETSLPGTGNRNIELKATLNLTWDLIGENGLFNQRSKMSSYYEKMIAREKYETIKRDVATKIRQSLNEVHKIENQMTILNPLLENNQKKFDEVMENFIQQNASFQDLNESINDLKFAQEKLEETIFQHIKLKIYLAQLMGLEDLPGENFENLADQGK